MITKNHINQISRRAVLKTGAIAAGALAMPALLTAEPKKPKELIVRAWGGNWKEGIEKGVALDFTAATGIKVVFDTTLHEEMKSKVWAALAQNRRPPIHVNWDISATAAESVLRDACVDLSDLSNLGGLTEMGLPQGVAGTPYVNVYTYVYSMAYATRAFPEGAPTSWSVMLDPKFKGRVGIYDTGGGIIEASQVAGGGVASDIPDNMEKGWDFLTKLRANEPLIGRDPDFTKWFQAGEIDVGCTILTNAVAIKKQGVDVAWTVPEEGAYAATDCLWVPKGLDEDETYWAKAFVNFALTKEAQQKWCNILGLPGTVAGFEPPAEFIGDPAYPITDEQFKQLIKIPAVVKSQYWGDWQLKFRGIMNV